MISIKTNLAGKIRNLPSFRSEALQPVFEAVVNSIQAISERGSLADGEVQIRVIREAQLALDEQEEPSISGFAITDNGVGFNPANFESFGTSDSTYKQDIGGKGVGRFLWLKAFDRVEVESTYVEQRKLMKRQFTFSTAHGIEEKHQHEVTGEQTTVVKLLGFKKEYRELPSAYKTTSKVAQRILEHCLSYFISGEAPRITVVDDKSTHVLNDIFAKEIQKHIVEKTLSLQGREFALAHIKLYSTHEKMHKAVLCANRREVKPISLSNALGTSTQFDDADRKFVYTLYVTSPYLDQAVDNYRLDFDFPDEAPILAEDVALSKRQIEEAIIGAAREFLREYLDKAMKRKQEIVADYVANENPALRAVPHYCPEVYDDIEPNSTPEKIDEVLHFHKGRAELAIRLKSDKLLKTQATSMAEIEGTYETLTAQIEDFQKDNLVGYLCHRKLMIDLLDRKLQLNHDGKYSNEAIIHDLVFPRKTTTEQLGSGGYNLWLIDETLTFHSLAVSDDRLSQTTSSDSDDRPDIVVFAEIDEDRVARAVSIIEFKKPQRPSLDQDPTLQLYNYLRKIRENSVKLPDGRDLRVSDDTRFYCYAICDLNPTIERYVDNNGNYAKLKGEIGYYMYNRNLNAHTEILGFDKIVIDAKRRHKAFFDKLGIA